LPHHATPFEEYQTATLGKTGIGISNKKSHITEIVDDPAKFTDRQDFFMFRIAE
jgi:hypothetical protein